MKPHITQALTYIGGGFFLPIAWERNVTINDMNERAAKSMVKAAADEARRQMQTLSASAEKKELLKFQKHIRARLTRKFPSGEVEIESHVPATWKAFMQL